MIVDVHTHFWSFSQDLDHVVLEDVHRVGGSHDMLTITPESYEHGTRGADYVIVMGLRARNTGFKVPNDRVAEFVKRDPARLIAFASVDPVFDRDPLSEIRRCVERLGMQGLKLSPTYQGLEPLDARMLPLYSYAEEHSLPIIFHQGTTFSRMAPLKYAIPILLEDVSYRFPELRMVVAHMGHPWISETISLIRKQPNVFADISALYYRPWQFYNALVLAKEYGVLGKLLFGTDFPFTTMKDSLRGIMSVNRIVRGTALPRLEKGELQALIHRDSLSLLFKGRPT